MSEQVIVIKTPDEPTIQPDNALEDTTHTDALDIAKETQETVEDVSETVEALSTEQVNQGQDINFLIEQIGKLQSELAKLENLSEIEARLSALEVFVIEEIAEETTEEVEEDNTAPSVEGLEFIEIPQTETPSNPTVKKWYF